ncbi:Serine/threonine-protein kinase AFC3 [Diplonema papillatum]|nr:Serine/threonine-protein kinase AFC3 [Diplonema papillatum]|eukprot:gene20890-32223_t
MGKRKRSSASLSDESAKKPRKEKKEKKDKKDKRSRSRDRDHSKDRHKHDKRDKRNRSEDRGHKKRERDSPADKDRNQKRRVRDSPDADKDRKKPEGPPKRDGRGKAGDAAGRDRKSNSEKTGDRGTTSSGTRRKRQQQFVGKPGMVLGSGSGGSYRLLEQLGEGTFSRVFEAEWLPPAKAKQERDGKSSKKDDDAAIRDRFSMPSKRPTTATVAIKVIRAEQTYMNTARDEIAVLCQLAEADPHRKRNFAEVFDAFHEQKNTADAPSSDPAQQVTARILKRYSVVPKHTCLVFPMYGPNLFEVIEKNGYKGFSRATVRSIAHQLLSTMQFVHDRSVIHTDIKPENVVFKDPRMFSSKERPYDPFSSEIVLVDFGSAIDLKTDQKRRTTVGTRHYRCPESIFQLTYGPPADVWAIGTMLVELATGDCMFQTHENEEHLAMMDRVLGPIPRGLIEKSRARSIELGTNPLFNRSHELYWPTSTATPEDIAFVKDCRSLSTQCRVMAEPGKSHNDFYDLIRELLHYDPASRLSCKEAMRQSFVATTTLRKSTVDE